MYSVQVSQVVRKQLNTLPDHVRQIAPSRILKLVDGPRPSDAKELEGHPDYYRVWIQGRFRLVWLIIDDELLVEVLYVGPKTPNLYSDLGLSRN